MVDKFLGVTRILKELFDDCESCKIVMGNEEFITNDPVKILNVLDVEDDQVRYVVKTLKDILKSRLCHRRYCARLLHSFLVFSTQVEVDDLQKVLKSELVNIKSVLNANRISIENLDDSQIFDLIAGDYPACFSELKRLRIEDIDSFGIQKIKCANENQVKLVSGAYFLLLSQESSGLKFFLQQFPNHSTKSGKAVHRFFGNIYISHSIKTQEFPLGSILISSEPCKVQGSENIHSVPPSLIKTLKRFSGFYECIKIKLWDNFSSSSCYSDKILYGSENYLSAEVTNIVIKFKTFTILINSPTDPQLEYLHVVLMRFINKLKRFKVSKTAVRGNIDAVIADSIRNQGLRMAFRNIQGSMRMQEFYSKEFMITKALDLYLQIIGFGDV